MELHELLNAVQDRDSFLRFAEALHADRALADAEEAKGLSHPFDEGGRGWRNGTIESFLDAALGWAGSADFGASAHDPSALWRQFALFLYMGKIYE
jgi:hypothetical protein